ncbi:MAG: hypothetical protein ACI87E_004983, partial [Mariniblastus sp.]
MELFPGKIAESVRPEINGGALVWVVWFWVV